ncbi:MAG: hypothetical protein V4864_22860 [Pseudomonadota bacterium]
MPMLKPRLPQPRSDDNPSGALRLTRGIALAWILVNAVSPVLSAVGWTALNKVVRPGDPLASWLPMALGCLAAFTLPVPILLQAAVLRRAAPALHGWQIVPALLVTWLLGLAIAAAGGDLRAVQVDLLRRARPLTEVRWDALDELSWVWRAGCAGVLAALCMLVPAWVFARAARVRCGAPLLAVTGASMTVAFLGALWLLAGVRFELLSASAMNGWPWWMRASALFTQATAQAIWAAAALLILWWMACRPHDATRLSQRIIPGTIALIAALLVPGAVAVLEPGGMKRLQRAAQRTLSPAPRRDVSTGEPLLQYAFSAAMPVRAIPHKASASPDGRWIVAVTSGDQVVVLDAATGAPAMRHPDVLGVHESPEWAWSPDSRWLALRTHGDLVPGKYARHQARLRVYTVPGFVQAGEYRHAGSPCLSDTHIENTVLFEQGDAALWLACGLEFQPAASDLTAIRLNVPQLQVQVERRYGDAAPWHLRGLKRVGASIWAWHTDQQPPYARFRDLSADRVPLVLQPPPVDRAAQPGWTLQEVSFDEVKSVARFHAWTERRRRLLAHDMRTGVLLSQTEDALPEDGAPQITALGAGGLRIESHVRRASGAGELLVLDASSGAARQRIRTVAQHLLSVSADGRLLVTQAGSELRVYRIQGVRGS